MARKVWHEAHIFWPEHAGITGYVRAYSTEGAGPSLQGVADFFADAARDRGYSRENGFIYKVRLHTTEGVDLDTLPEPTLYAEDSDEDE